MRDFDPNLSILYVGEQNGIESKLIKDIPFLCIPSGKLRRYFDLKNFIDIFKVFAGVLKSIFLLIKYKPTLVFSKGGYVSLPLGIATFFTRTKLIIHESDLSPGLTTKILSPLANKILLGYKESLPFFNNKKCVFVGNPIRKDIFKGSPEKAYKFLNWKKSDLPILLIMGGSLGSQKINHLLKKNLATVVKNFRVIHITGKQNHSESGEFSHPNYRHYDFLNQELADIYSITNFAISRAGAGAIAELMVLKIPTIFIPFTIGGRGDQLENAKLLVEKNCAILLQEEKINSKKFLTELLNLKGDEEKKSNMKKNMQEHFSYLKNSSSKILDLIIKEL